MNLPSIINEYVKFRSNANIHDSTIALETSYIQKFHKSLVGEDNEYIPPERITPKMVENFLNKEREVLSDRTVYRKITILIHYFDFLWHKNYIPTDFMPKFRKRFDKLDWELPTLRLSYEDMLSHKEEIYDAQEIPLMARLIFFFMLNGLELKEMLSFEVQHIIEKENYILLQYVNEWGLERTITVTDEREKDLLLTAVQTANERNVPYLLSGKTEGLYHQYNPSNIHDMMKPISSIVGHNLTSTKQTLYAYIYYLTEKQKMKIDAMATYLALPSKQLTKLIKSVYERVE